MPCGGFFCAVVGGNEGRGRCGRGWRETWQCAAVSAVAADDAVVEVGTVAAVAVVDVDDVGRNVAGRARPLVVVMSWEGVAVVGDVLPFLVSGVLVVYGWWPTWYICTRPRHVPGMAMCKPYTAVCMSVWLYCFPLRCSWW